MVPPGVRLSLQLRLLEAADPLRHALRGCRRRHHAAERRAARPAGRAAVVGRRSPVAAGVGHRPQLALHGDRAAVSRRRLAARVHPPPLRVDRAASLHGVVRRGSCPGRSGAGAPTGVFRPCRRPGRRHARALVPDEQQAPPRRPAGTEPNRAVHHRSIGLLADVAREPSHRVGRRSVLRRHAGARRSHPGDLLLRWRALPARQRPSGATSSSPRSR